ncbi:MAG TPA: hypothetical protein VGN17_11570 [Bryobacteraceae bacterium]|jgi:hypothetical protein
MNPTRVKLIAAIVLLICLALPEYTCSRYIGPDGQTLSAGPEGVPTTPYREVRENHYPLESFNLREIGWWIALLSFTWPWPVLIYWWRNGALGGLARAVWVAEPLLAIGSGWAVWEASSVGHRAVGAWLALAADAVYLGAWIAGLRKRRN